jgi:CubicO group peptidase (beta-lactamase class C family)
MILFDARAWALVLCVSPAVATAAATPTLAQQVDAYVAPLVRTNNFSGVVLVDRGGDTVLARSYGAASLEYGIDNAVDTRFQIASLSKPFTSAAILRLVDQGKLDLQAPLAAVLPDYPGGDRLTLHHLLSHRSGIPNINDFPEYETMQATPHTTAELVAVFRDRPLEMAPGADYSYSNSNYNLLAHVVERVSGTPYGDFLEREFLAPLVLRDTGHHGRMTDVVPRLATGYAPRGAQALERAAYVDWSNKTGNGSLYSTANDLVTFTRAVHRDLLAPASRDRLFEPHSENAGYGWFLSEANGRAVHHVNGRSPGWAAQLDHYVADDVTVVVLSNIYSSVTTPIARAVGAMVFDAPVTPLTAVRSEPLSAGEIGALTGTYRFGPDYYVPDSAITIVERDGRIEAEYSTGYTPSGYIPVSATEFIVRPFWSSAKFVLGDDGRATALVIDGFTGHRE